MCHFLWFLVYLAHSFQAFSGLGVKLTSWKSRIRKMSNQEKVENERILKNKIKTLIFYKKNSKILNKKQFLLKKLKKENL